MGKTGLGAFGKRVRLSVLSFDLKPAIVLGFALHWTWVWVVFWSSMFYSVSPAADVYVTDLSLEPLWLLSLLANVAGYVFLFTSSRKNPTLGSLPAAPLVAAAVTLAGTFLVSYPSAVSFGDAGSFAYVLGGLLTGVGSAAEVVLWAELLSVLGVRQTVVYSVLATFAGSALYLSVSLLPEQVARFLTVLIPAAEMRLLVREKGLVLAAGKATIGDFMRIETQQAPRRTCPAADRRALLEIAGISLFFGFSYGIMKGFFALSGEHLIIVRDYLNIGALMLGAAAILTTTSIFRMDFRHMTYQIALPLMAAGFIFFSLSYPYDLVGFALHQLGYQYFYIVIWALWILLARKMDEPATRFASLSMAMLMAGQLLGSIAGARIVVVVADAYAMAMIAACCVFVILLVSLFAFSRPFPDSGWNMFDPSSPDERTPRFKRSLKRLADMRGLSPRETEVLLLLAKGRNCSFISAQLVISEETAKTHIKRIYKKFGVHSQQALLDLIDLDGDCRPKG